MGHCQLKLTIHAHQIKSNAGFAGEGKTGEKPLGAE